jgi:glycosyltransferase involved in cell wall biosynthesis
VRRPRIVATVETFNEADFLPRWLGHVETIADAIVAIDDGSEDDSAEVLRRHPKVTRLIAKKRGKRHEVKDRRILTKLALEEGADWILNLDADEVFDARVREVLPRLLADSEGVAEFRFRKFHLWRGEEQIRTDRPERFSAPSPVRLVRAVPGMRWRYPAGSDLRRLAAALIRRRKLLPQFGHGEIEGIPGRIVEVPPEELVIVHYASVDFTAMIQKQLRYAVGESRNAPRRDPDDIATWAFRSLDETGLELAPVPEEWKPLP